MEKEPQKTLSKPKRPLWKRILRIALKTITVVLVLFFILVLVVRSEWGQNLIVTKATDYVSSKTNTKVDWVNADMEVCEEFAAIVKIIEEKKI